MCNKVKSEQHFVVTGSKRLAIIQASLKLIKEEARAKLSNKDNKCLTSHESIHLHKSGHCK